MNDLISVKNLNYSYCSDKNSGYFIKDVNFSVKQGEFISIVGKNGSGKSTLAKLINLTLVPSSGEIVVDGISSLNQSNWFEIKKKIGLVFQNPDNQLVTTIVEEDVAFALENLCMPVEKMKKIVDENLKLVEMEEFSKNSVDCLSGGQKQRVAIAGVSVLKPKCLIFDESTAMINPEGRKKIWELVDRLNKEQNVAIIFVSHDLEEIVKSDRVILMNEGKIFKITSPKELVSNENLLKLAGIEFSQSMKLINLLFEKGLLKEKIAVTSTDECYDAVSLLLKGD